MGHNKARDNVKRKKKRRQTLAKLIMRKRALAFRESFSGKLPEEELKFFLSRLSNKPVSLKVVNQLLQENIKPPEFAPIQHLPCSVSALDNLPEDFDFEKLFASEVVPEKIGFVSPDVEADLEVIQDEVVEEVGSLRIGFA